jgi:excisionase family DNA binding protein
MAELREVMNIKEASEYLGVSADTLYKYVCEERIPAFKLGNRWKFKKSRLDQWMDQQSSCHEERGKKKAKPGCLVAGRR